MDRHFGILLDHGKVVAIGNVEEITYGPGDEEWFLVTADGTFHTASASMLIIDVPTPSMN